MTIKTCLSNFYLVCLTGLLSTGCKTYQGQNKSMANHWEQGHVTNAVQEYTIKAEMEKNSKDAIIWRLEQAAALRAAGQFKESISAFEAAEERIDKYDEGAKIKIVREAGALLSNQAQLPYEGRAYDKILLNTYKALNYLQLGEPEKARVEFIRAQQRQDEAVEINKARIEKAEAQLAKQKEKEKFDSDKVNDDPKFKTQFDGAYAFLDQYKAEANYKNPAAIYLHGLFFMAASTGLADLEMAKHSFDEVTGMVGESKFIQHDQELLKQLMGGQSVPPTTYVIFETGRAPIRDQIRIDLPLFIVGVAKVPYVAAAWPLLKPQDGQIPSLMITVGQTNEPTVLLASMDTIVGREFKNELPTILTKTMASTLTKAAIAYAAVEAVKREGWAAQLAAQIVFAAWQASVNIADTRTWTTLPKEFQVCYVTTPADRKIQIASRDGLLKTEVTVAEGTFNLIYVKSINTTSPLLVSHISLTPSKSAAVNPGTAAPAVRPTVRQTVAENVVATAAPPPPAPVSDTLEQRPTPVLPTPAVPEVAPPKGSRSVRSVTLSEPVPVKPAPKDTLTLPSKSKAERLAELNARYLSNRIAPREYHQRRAEIVADSN